MEDDSDVIVFDAAMDPAELSAEVLDGLSGKIVKIWVQERQQLLEQQRDNQKRMESRMGRGEPVLPPRKRKQKTVRRYFIIQR